jgi:hypothetical protein
VLKRVRIEVDGATPDAVYAQLDHYHEALIAVQQRRIAEGTGKERLIDSDVTEEVIELGGGEYVDYEGGTVPDEHALYVGRRVVALHPNVAPHAADVPWKTTWSASGAAPSDLREAQRLLTNVVLDPTVVGAPEVRYQGHEWAWTVKFHQSGRDAFLRAQSTDLLEIARSLYDQLRAEQARDLPETS